ncbi:DUF2591 domain-containing protein [bacterium]|nr:DUF2591 domain-containing protein [bacterium]
MQASELQGAALDWAVALIEFPEPDYEDDDRLVYVHGDDEFHFTPSTDWAQGGPIIEREGICSGKYFNGPNQPFWIARLSYCIRCPDGNGLSFCYRKGPTPLIAAMRCYVASKLGEEINIPEELK